MCLANFHIRTCVVEDENGNSIGYTTFNMIMVVTYGRIERGFRT